MSLQDGPAATQAPAALIDMHCHVFNASDLPASNFLRRVITESYGADADAGTLGLGMLIAAVVGNAPIAADELADIAHGRVTPDNSAAVTAAGADGGLIDWLRLFAKPRRQLIAKLASFYAATQSRCELIAPAMVDFNCWLDHPDSQGQRLTDQVAVMGAIARLPGKPRVHGFVGFDPVRAILANNEYNPCAQVELDRIHPLDLVKDAVNKHGFLGVKLYPPMGFRAWHNGKGDVTFSSSMKQYVNVCYPGIGDKQMGQLIDDELAKLYRYCADEGVPILAHAYNSNQADECTGWRASPQYWGEVIDNFSTAQKPLRICLGHFGSFSAHTRFQTCSGFSNKAWEVIIGSILAKAGGEYVFADVSYMSEVLDRSDGWQARLNKARDQFKSFIAANDAKVEHICYGSDWNMLGRETGHARYHVMLGDFLRNDVQLTAAQLDNVYVGNAVRFLGLRPGDQNRERLEKFYDDNNIRPHFPQIDALVG
jgi:predicted TIM-barrel fold metal-dependent hydrolase